jgi:hypothetical protein
VVIDKVVKKLKGNKKSRPFLAGGFLVLVIHKKSRERFCSRLIGVFSGTKGLGGNDYRSSLGTAPETPAVIGYRKIIGTVHN